MREAFRELRRVPSGIDGECAYGSIRNFSQINILLSSFFLMISCGVQFAGHNAPLNRFETDGFAMIRHRIH